MTWDAVLEIFADGSGCKECPFAYWSWDEDQKVRECALIDNRPEGAPQDCPGHDEEDANGF